jgi:hypothetical protein
MAHVHQLFAEIEFPLPSADSTAEAADDPDESVRLDGVKALLLFGVGMLVALTVLAMLAG